MRYNATIWHVRASLTVGLISLCSHGCGSRGATDEVVKLTNSQEPRAQKASSPASDSTRPITETTEPVQSERVELSEVHKSLHGSFIPPKGVSVKRTTLGGYTKQGFEADIYGLKLGGGQLIISNDPLDLDQSSTPEDLINAQKELEHVSTHRFGSEHWAVVRRWSGGECRIDGVHHRAGLVCGAYKVSCDQVSKWLDVCASIKPGASSNRYVATPASAFPSLEPKAAEVAWDVTQALLQNKLSLLTKHLGPQGLEIARRRLTASQLATEVSRSSVVDVVAKGWSEIEKNYVWRAQLNGEEVVIEFNTEYGGISSSPTFTLVRGPRAWILSKVTEHYIANQEDEGEVPPGYNDSEEQE